MDFTIFKNEEQVHYVISYEYYKNHTTIAIYKDEKNIKSPIYTLLSAYQKMIQDSCHNIKFASIFL